MTRFIGVHSYQTRPVYEQQLVGVRKGTQRGDSF